MKFRKRPVVIEAIQYTAESSFKIRQWANGKVVESPVLEPTPDNPTGQYLQIHALGGTVIACIGDWIIKGVNGEFYPCKPDIFEKTYEPAPEGE